MSSTVGAQHMKLKYKIRKLLKWCAAPMRMHVLIQRVVGRALVRQACAAYATHTDHKAASCTVYAETCVEISDRNSRNVEVTSKIAT